MDARLANDVMGPWEAEAIPDEDELYMRVHKNEVQGGEPILGVFRNRPDPARPDRLPAMSTDWCKYSTPTDSRNRARSSTPTDNGVLSLNVGKVRAIYRQSVEHTPRYRTPEDPQAPNNRAHTDVAGPKSPKEAGPEERSRILQVRVEFSLISRWEIPPP